jgi:hypothetical protein
MYESEHIAFECAKPLRNWREQRPSTQDDLDSTLWARLGVLHEGGPGYDLIFVP